MLRYGIPLDGEKWRVLPLIPVFLFSVFFGIASALLPWFFLVALGLAVVYFIILYKKPWLGIWCYLFAVLISPDLKLSDVLTFASLLIVFAKLIIERHFFSLPVQLKNPYFIFMGMVVFSLFWALLYKHHAIPYIYRDGRVFLYWLWLPIIYSLLRNENGNIQKLANVLVCFALVVSVVALLQAVTGVQFVASGRVIALETGGVVDSSLTRVQIPGYAFVSFSMLLIFVNLIYGRINIFIGIFALVIFSAAIYVNFGRALWAWTFAGFVFSLFFMERTRAIAAAISGTVLCILAVLAIGLIKPAIIDSVVARATSVQDEDKAKSSYGWRKLENNFALRKIESTPLVGIGVGGEYRPWVPELRLFEEHTRYVHNSYIFMALKIGVPALLSVLWLSFVVWRRAKNDIKKYSNNKIAVVKVAAVSSLPAFLGLCTTQPELMAELGVVFIVMIQMLLFASPEIDIE